MEKITIIIERKLPRSTHVLAARMRKAGSIVRRGRRRAKDKGAKRRALDE
jgi:hypothetical protein